MTFRDCRSLATYYSGSFVYSVIAIEPVWHIKYLKYFLPNQLMNIYMNGVWPCLEHHHFTFKFSYSCHKTYFMPANRQNAGAQDLISQHREFGKEHSFSAKIDFDWKRRTYSCCFCLICVIRCVTMHLCPLLEVPATSSYLLFLQCCSRLSTQSTESSYPFIMPIGVLFRVCWHLLISPLFSHSNRIFLSGRVNLGWFLNLCRCIPGIFYFSGQFLRFHVAFLF